jgi:hypothetical protein
MDGSKNFGPEFIFKYKLIEQQASKLHPAAVVAMNFSCNYTNLNKALFIDSFFRERIKNKIDLDGKTITIVSCLFPLIYIGAVNSVFKNCNINVITNQYTTIKLQYHIEKYFPNVKIYDKHPLVDKDIEHYFDQSDYVVIPDSDYLMPFIFLDHYKFKNCLVINFKDPHERKTNNHLTMSPEDLMEDCTFSTVHEIGTYNAPDSRSNFFTNNRIFYAYGDRLWGKD